MVHKELLEYHRLKRRWGRGHIKIKLTDCRLKHCEGRLERVLHENMKNKHTNVFGYYLDEDNNIRYLFLGYTHKKANKQLEYVKRCYHL